MAMLLEVLWLLLWLLVAAAVLLCSETMDVNVPLPVLLNVIHNTWYS
jgi:hypothetical protein